MSSIAFDPIESASGTETLELYEKEKPDIVLMDLLMPDIDGMEVIKKILEFDNEAKTVICTTDRQQYRREEAKELGVMGFLTKPIDREKMIEALNKIFDMNYS